MIKRIFRFLLRYKSIKSTNYGRKCGWYIELNGVVVGELIDYQYIDMLWDSYLVVPKDEASDTILHEPSNWYDSKFQYKNKGIVGYASNAFSGGDYEDFCNRTTDRISMRGLYVF